MSPFEILEIRSRCVKAMFLCSKGFYEWIQENNSISTEGFQNQLDSFQKQKEKMTKTLKIFDQKMALVVRHSGHYFLNSQYKNFESGLIRLNQEILDLIKLDKAISAKLEERKKKILKDLLNVQKEKSFIRKFKSDYTEQNGIQLDGKL